MRWLDLIWLPPLMAAIAVVLGATGRHGRRSTMRAIVHHFVALTLGVVIVGLAIHVVARIFS